MCKFLLQSVASWDLCLFDALGDLWYGSIGPINFTPDDDKPLWNIYVDLEHNNNNNQISAESRNIALTNSVTNHYSWFWHIEVWWKWLPFWRRFLPNRFYRWNFYIWNHKFCELCCWVFNWQYVSNGYSNGIILPEPMLTDFCDTVSRRYAAVI